MPKHIVGFTQESYFILKVAIYAKMMRPTKQEAWHANEKQDEANVDCAIGAEELKKPLHASHATSSLSLRRVCFSFDNAGE